MSQNTACQPTHHIHLPPSSLSGERTRGFHLAIHPCEFIGAGAQVSSSGIFGAGSPILAWVRSARSIPRSRVARGIVWVHGRSAVGCRFVGHGVSFLRRRCRIGCRRVFGCGVSYFRRARGLVSRGFVGRRVWRAGNVAFLVGLGHLAHLVRVVIVVVATEIKHDDAAGGGSSHDQLGHACVYLHGSCGVCVA